MNISTHRIYELKSLRKDLLPKDWCKRLRNSPESYLPNFFPYIKVTSPDKAFLETDQRFTGETEHEHYTFTNHMDHPVFFRHDRDAKLVHAPCPKRVLLLEDIVLITFRPKLNPIQLFLCPKVFFQSCFTHAVALEPDVFNYLYEHKPEAPRTNKAGNTPHM